MKFGEMQSNEYGKIARKLWLEIPNHFGNARIDEYVIMPNHLHGIIILDDKREDDKINVETLQCNDTANARENEFYSKISPRPKSLSTIIRSYKSTCTRMINELETLQCNVSTKFGWQSGFYDHVIRNDSSLDKIREYILNNPAQWADDEYNLAKRKQKKEQL